MVLGCGLICRSRFGQLRLPQFWRLAADLEKHFGAKLYRTIVPRNVRLAEAPSHGMPALKLELQSKGAQAYLALAGEMLRRMEAKEVVA
mgnify:CR=1 FL=1